MRVVMLVACALLVSLTLRAQTGTVSGAVFDSLEGQPLAGALVQIVASPPRQEAYSATANSLGRFRIENVRAGQYIAGFLHPLLDSLGVTAPYRAITVAENATAQVALAVPSAAKLIHAICAPAQESPAASVADQRSALVGHVQDAESGASVPGSLVAVVWSVLVLDARGARRESQQLHGRTNADGWFAMCGLEEGEYRVRAELGKRATGFVDVALRPRELARASFALGSDSDSATATDSTPRPGGATIEGSVTTTGGRPLEGVQIAVEGSPSHATTDARGVFSLSGLPDGTRMAEARALGYAPVRVEVEPSRRGPRTVPIVMDRKVKTLDAVTVYGKRSGRMRDVSGFVERQQRGFGRFITRADIDRSNTLTVCELFRRVAGLSVREEGVNDCEVSMRGTLSLMGPSAGVTACEPTLYVDNAPFNGSVGEFTRTIRPRDIMGIEVYSTSTEPLQFPGGCGSIVVWTR